MWFYLLQGVGYGLIAGSQPGPFQTYLVSQTLTRGWKRTLPAAFAPLLSDGPIIVLCVLVLRQVPLWLQSFLSIAGGLFILYLAYGTYNSWRNFAEQRLQAEPPGHRSILKAALMNALSPNPYIFWTFVIGPILLNGWRETPWHGLGFLVSFYFTLIMITVALVMIFGTAARMGPHVNRILLGISTMALLFFGFYQLWRGLMGR
jgi:threonine/homoserine/homoserine lactone efflux protein